MMQASPQPVDPNVVCTTSAMVPLTIRQLLIFQVPLGSRKRWVVPAFQRRYCWKSVQIKKLFGDVLRHCSLTSSCGLSKGHEMGRIVSHTQTLSNDMLIIDGQQRIATVCILISALCEFLLELIATISTQPMKTFSNNDSSSEAEFSELALLCHSILFSTATSKKCYKKDAKRCIFEPSYFDRSSFDVCINNIEPATSSDVSKRMLNTSTSECTDVDGRHFKYSSGESRAKGINSEDNIVQCKSLFHQSLREGSTWKAVAASCGDHLHIKDDGVFVTYKKIAVYVKAIVHALLDKCTVMHFSLKRGLGGLDLQLVYERLAQREALVDRGLANASPGIPMTEMDLVRNMLTSYVCSSDESVMDHRQTQLYVRHWKPIEQLAMDVSKIVNDVNDIGDDERDCSGDGTMTSTLQCLDSLVHSFVSHSNDSHERHHTYVHCGEGCGSEITMASGTTVIPHQPSLSTVMDLALINQLAHLKEGLYDDDADASGKYNVSTVPCSDPGAAFFPTYHALKVCVQQALQRKNLSPNMQQPSSLEAEAVICKLLDDLLKFGESDWRMKCLGVGGDKKHDTTSTRVASGEGNHMMNGTKLGKSVNTTPCPCMSLGTLCTDCIVKKFAKK